MDKHFLSIKQAAEFSSLSQRFVYKLCHDRKLKHYTVGRRIVINLKDLDEYIKQNVQEVVDWDEKARGLR